MPTAISRSQVQILETDRSAAQRSNDKIKDSSPMTAVALVVSSFVLGLILFGPSGALAFTTVALIGIGMWMIMTDEDCVGSVNLHHTHHTYQSRHYTTPAPTFTWSWDATPLNPRQPSSYIPTARRPSPSYSAPQRPASGPHLPRGHVPAPASSLFERKPGAHLPRGHVRH